MFMSEAVKGVFLKLNGRRTKDSVIVEKTFVEVDGTMVEKEEKEE